jgi:Fur family transcriptional regulator, ferric uptake regulator
MSPQSELRDTLRGSGRRLTDQRQLLLELLQEHGGHLDAHELYRLAQERDPRLNLSTVYRTLGLLRDLGLVDEQHLGEDHHHYELKAPATHHHLICGTCGSVVEFTSPLIEQLKEAVGRELDYTIADAQVDLLGTCAGCRAAVAPPATAPKPQPKTGPRTRMVNILRRSLHPGDAVPPETQPNAAGHDEALSLRALPTGSSARVAALTGGHDLVARLAALGLTPGVRLEVAQNPGHGPIIVLVRDTRLVLGRGEAAHILVTPTGAEHGHQGD